MAPAAPKTRSKRRPPSKVAPQAARKHAPGRAPAKPRKRTAAQGRIARALPGATTGKASAAPAAEGDAPVRAYIASLPAPQRAIAKRVDALAARTLPGLQRSVKWGMAFYGVGDGWCFSCGGFADHVKVTFLHGTALKPVPPVGTAKYTRGVDLVGVGDIDEAKLASWMRQASARPGLGAGRKAKARPASPRASAGKSARRPARQGAGA